MFAKITDDWFNVFNIGQRIENTPFIPFKVPLMPSECSESLKPEQTFTIEDLVSKEPRIGLIVDLTCSHYYDANCFRQLNIEHEKLFIPGGGQLPQSNDVQRFLGIIKKFTTKSEQLIGVHCMHGVNRTGFMICKYMIEELSFSPKEAIDAFEKARGHRINRKAYIENLLKTEPKVMANEHNYSHKLKLVSQFSEQIGTKQL